MTTTRRLKIFNLGIHVAVALAALLMAQITLGQNTPALYQPDPDSPIGERNEKAPPELTEYDFVIGDWNAEVRFIKPNGSSAVSNARWHNIWIAHGNVVLQKWRGP
ncbi:MAG: hypothetical protein WBS20_16145 [Lysobacterales bacterium]